MRAAEFLFECGLTRRDRDLKLQLLCPHSTISRPGSKLLSFSYRLNGSERSWELRSTRFEQDHRDLKLRITQLITLNNFLTRIGNSHDILRSPVDQLLIQMISGLPFYRESISAEQSLRCVETPWPNYERGNHGQATSFHRRYHQQNIWAIQTMSPQINAINKTNEAYKNSLRPMRSSGYATKGSRFFSFLGQ
jgi:hypothetical protein